MKESIASRVEAMAEPIAKECGVELFDVEFVKEGPDHFLRLFITKEDGVDLDDCEAVSRAIDPLLDEADFIKEHYYLEVSSVGLDRHLKKEKDFLYFMGEKIEVKLFKAYEGSDLWIGTLVGYEDGNFAIETDRGEMVISLKEARLVRPFVEFGKF